MMRGQNVQALDRIFQDNRLKCPSGSQFLKDLDMDMKVDFIWLPIDRVALLMNKNLKTIRRMVDAGKLTALKHQKGILGQLRSLNKIGCYRLIV